MERAVILLLFAAVVGCVVGVGAAAIRNSQDPAAIEAADPTDQLERAIAGLPPIEREEPSLWVREPALTGAGAAMVVLVLGGLMLLATWRPPSA